jgi:1,4-dihydroxy-2-naphthoyl-CoA hydrolase
MSIWTTRPELAQLNSLIEGTLLESLDIRFTEVRDDAIVGSMAVDRRTHQPYGILHGGASVALAESLGSMAGHFCRRDPETQVVGQHVDAHHLRPVRSGRVHGTARPVHIGRRSQLWEVRITDDADRLICVSDLVLAVIPVKGAGSLET